MDIDLNDSVQRLEAKCAGVREELGRMALSEQYMRTKQAQLRARKKELEAKEATIKAELREKEAYVSSINKFMMVTKLYIPSNFQLLLRVIFSCFIVAKFFF